MKKQTLALLLATALIVSLLGTAALAAEGEPSDSSAASSLNTEPDSSAAPDASAPLDGEALPDSSAAEDGLLVQDTMQNQPEQTDDEAGTDEESVGDVPDYIPDPVGTISFQNLAPRMREGNLNVLAIEENIQVIRAFDYDEMQEDLRKGLNEIANAQWSLISAGSMVQLPSMPNLPDELVGGINAALSASISMSTSTAAQALQSQYDALRSTFDDLKDGKLQADNEDLIRQLENAQNQVILAGETLYIALVDMEQGGQALERNLETLDRTLEELELRYRLGHVSVQTLEQARAGRTSLLSGQQTLNSNVEIYKTQLEQLIGAQLTGKIRLGALPQVSDADLSAMDLEADLEAAKAASYSLYEARQTLSDAEKDYKKAGRKYDYSERHYEFVQAQHQWQAAQYSYTATVQNFEMSLRTLFLQVKDNRQILEAAQAALSIEQSNYEVAQLKYSQGTLSENALLEVEDKVKQAQEAIDDAAINLFSSYHKYRWAVDYGILN